MAIEIAYKNFWVSPFPACPAPNARRLCIDYGWGKGSGEASATWSFRMQSSHNAHCTFHVTRTLQLTKSL